MKRWAVYLARVVVCSSLALAAGCATSSRSGSRSSDSDHSASDPAFADALAHYSAGLALEWQDREAESFSNFLRAAELDPNNAELQFRVALTLAQQKRGPEAVAMMERLAKRNPKSEQVQLWLALIYHATGQLDQALGAYDRVRKINPKASVSYLQKAELLLRQKRFEDAVSVLESGLDKVDQPLDLYRALGPLEHSRARADLAAGRTPTRLPKAIRLFERALQRYPDEVGLREVLGRFYIMDGQVDKAIDIYAPLEGDTQGDLRKTQELATSFLLGPDREATLQTLADRTEREPGNAWDLYYLGTVLEHSKMLDDASEAYRRAITAAPSWPAPYLRRVVLQVADQEPEEAILTLEDGLQQLPGEVRFLELLSYIQLGRQDYAGALEAFARTEQALEAQKKEPISSSFYLSYAFAQQVSGHYAEAAQRLSQAMAGNPAYLDAYIQYAFRSGETNNLDGCAQVIEELGRSTNATAMVHAYQGLLHNYRQDYPAAIKAFEQAEQMAHAQENEDEVLSPIFYFWYASACERVGEFDRAVKLFERILAQKPAPENAADFKIYVDALNYHAYMHAERGLDLDLALKHINEALEARPDNAAFLDTRGWIYFMQGRTDEARVEIQHALELLPDDPTVTDHMGDIEAKLGQTAEAITWWKKSFLLDPSNEKVADKLKAQGVDVVPLREEAVELEKKNSAARAENADRLPDFDLDEPELIQPEAPTNEDLPDVPLLTP